MTTSQLATRAPRRDAAENRTAILDAAARELALDPAASIETIAAQAGLSRRALYGHFASRDDLVRALVLRAGERIARSADDIDTTDSRVAIALIARRLWREIDHATALAQLAVRGPLAATVAELLSPVRVRLRESVAQGIRSGQLRQDVEPALLSRLVEGACLAVLDEASRSSLGGADGARLVMHAALSMAGLSWDQAHTFIETAEESA